MPQRERLKSFEHLLLYFAIAAGVIFALGAPAFLALYDYNALQGTLSFQARILTDQIAVFANIQGETWQYSFHRLPEFVTIIDPNEEIRATISAMQGKAEKVVLDVGPAQSHPVLTVRDAISVGGETIGFVELTQSMRPIVNQIAVVTAITSIIGLFLFFILHRVPMRLLRQSTSALEASRKRLAKEINLKEIEARRANDASRIKSDFLSNMSHEMRTPLNAIIGFSKVMEDQLFGELSPHYRSYAKDINDSGQHLLGLINSLLDLSKIERNMADLTIDQVSIHKTIADTIRLVADHARSKNIDLPVDYDDDLPDTITTDQTKLYQIIINLVSNAVKYTPRNGTVGISVRSKNNDVEIEIFDTGIGMSEEGIRVALKPFGQVKTAFTTPEEGTGLGLPLAKSLTELLHGQFTIKSQLGNGTTITVRLPKRIEVRPAVIRDADNENLDKAVNF